MLIVGAKFQMNNGGPPSNGGFRGSENGAGGGSGPGPGQPAGLNGVISTEAAIAALGQHDQLFQRQLLQIRQQQVGKNQKTLSYKFI